MAHDIDVVEYDPLCVLISLAVPYAFVLFFHPFDDPVGDGAELDIGSGGCQHKEVCDRREFSQVQYNNVFGAAFGGEFSTQPGADFPGGVAGCAARAALGGRG